MGTVVSSLEGSEQSSATQTPTSAATAVTDESQEAQHALSAMHPKIQVNEVVDLEGHTAPASEAQAVLQQRQKARPSQSPHSEQLEQPKQPPHTALESKEGTNHRAQTSEPTLSHQKAQPQRRNEPEPLKHPQKQKLWPDLQPDPQQQTKQNPPIKQRRPSHPIAEESEPIMLRPSQKPQRSLQSNEQQRYAQEPAILPPRDPPRRHSNAPIQPRKRTVMQVTSESMQSHPSPHRRPQSQREVESRKPDQPKKSKKLPQVTLAPKQGASQKPPPNEPLHQPERKSSSLLPSTPQLFCDVCWGRPHKQGMIFRQCRECGVGVHNECYGIPGNVPVQKDGFVCLACRAIGTTVTVRAREQQPRDDEHDQHSDATSTNPGRRSRSVSKRRLPRQQFTMLERPTECCLCSVDDGTDWYHAMHPVYDHYGPSGRQLVLPPNDDHNYPRLAWAHTLCLLTIGVHRKTRGCVYGCDAWGSYDGEGDDDNSDTSSVNSDLLPADDHEDDGSLHHFVYCLRLKRHQADNAWTKAIAEQQSLKCQICGSNDKRRDSFKIPLQCSANDETEFADFHHSHRLLHSDTCYVAMHVGCAIWGRNDVGQLPNNRRVYFFPGRNKRFLNDSNATKEASAAASGSSSSTVHVKRGATKSVANVFCPVHAQDLVRRNIAGSTTLRYPAQPKQPPRVQSADAAISRKRTRSCSTKDRGPFPDQKRRAVRSHRPATGKDSSET
jgi:hypothetical protein